MLIKFSIKLKCHHRGKNFSIIVGKDSHTINKDCDITVDAKDYYFGQPNLKLFSLTGLTSGLNQRVTVEGITINDVKWQNYFKFCEFQMKENLYVENKTISPCWELCFNGDFIISISADRKQFEFSSFYRSRQRQDFVFNNLHLDANENHNYWCFSCTKVNWLDNHTNSWGNEPFMPEYQQFQQYDFGCFGCSFTRGTGLRRGAEWPALLKQDCGSVINLAESRLGADGIFLNLKSALQQFRLGGVVILWPALNRFCCRWRVDDWHLRMPITLNSTADEVWGGPNIWFDRQKYSDMISIFQDRCVRGEIGRRSRRIIAKTVRLLSDQGLPAWHSSWDEEVYHYLESLSLGDGLLGAFPRSDRGAMDGEHPSEGQQSSWYDSIKSQIGILS